MATPAMRPGLEATQDEIQSSPAWMRPVRDRGRGFGGTVGGIDSAPRYGNTGPYSGPNDGVGYGGEAGSTDPQYGNPPSNMYATGPSDGSDVSGIVSDASPSSGPSISTTSSASNDYSTYTDDQRTNKLLELYDNKTNLENKLTEARKELKQHAPDWMDEQAIDRVLTGSGKAPDGTIDFLPYVSQHQSIKVDDIDKAMNKINEVKKEQRATKRKSTT